jgi:cell wall-associated protease
VASFSNYGKESLDIFAPGNKIYSTVPGNAYKFEGGTSMAAPAVAGIAALVRSYYPDLSAAQVKRIIMESGVAPQGKVVVGEGSEKSLSDISKSGKIANLYNALILADQVSRGKINI